MVDLREIASLIDKSHEEAIIARATSGQVRSFELLWVTLVMRHHNYQVVPSLTGKQRQNLRDYISRFGPERALSLLNFSVKNWSKAKALYQFLPPRPVWDSFYFHRDKFLALLVEDTERTAKGMASVEQAKRAEKEASHSKVSLVEMFKRARKGESNDNTAR